MALGRRKTNIGAKDHATVADEVKESLNFTKLFKFSAELIAISFVLLNRVGKLPS